MSDEKDLKVQQQKEKDEKEKEVREKAERDRQQKLEQEERERAVRTQIHFFYIQAKLTRSAIKVKFAVQL